MLGFRCPPPLQLAPDPPPPQDPAPPPSPRPEIGWKVGGSRRMARWYAPPPWPAQASAPRPGRPAVAHSSVSPLEPWPLPWPLPSPFQRNPLPRAPDCVGLFTGNGGIADRARGHARGRCRWVQGGPGADGTPRMPRTLCCAGSKGRTLFVLIAKKNGFAKFMCKITCFSNFRRPVVLVVGPTLGA